MLTEHLHFPTTETASLLEAITLEAESWRYDFPRHLVELEDDAGHRLGYMRLPPSLTVNSDLSIQDEDTIILYLSINSDNAAIIVMEGEEECFHTTFGAYMTRKKQGYSQIKHLNKKGKSRAGSRIRLNATVEFFESINETLEELFEEFEIERIALHCSPTLIPYLHGSKVSCPFDKTDDRLYKIPLHIHKSNYTNLSEALRKLSAPTLVYDPNKRDGLAYLF